MTSLLVIDDEPLILTAIQLAFPDFDVVARQDGAGGLQAFRQSTPDVVLCDIRLPDRNGMDIIEDLHRLNPQVPIILMTGHGTASTAIEAMQRGAFEYVLKPLDPDLLIPLVEQAAESSRMARVPAILPDDDPDQELTDGDVLIGQCQAMQEVYRSIGRVAARNVTVLILGESGTGKEVVARAIYHYSGRSNGRFLAVNCAAIPEQLLESELFGHEKGAFTGADRKRIGKFELCSEGTLFLDEIGDMTPLMQTKILRVLQDQTFERVGGSETVHSHARIITATNRNLKQAIADKEFRSDLFYRLNVYTIQLPPLRERGDDIRLLTNHLVRRFSREMNKPITGVAPATLASLQQYHWPGNVRELQSALRHALLQATGPVLVPAFLPEYLSHKPRLADAGADAAAAAESVGHESLDDHGLRKLTRERLAAGSHEIHHELISLAERLVFIEVLTHTGGNLTQAAKRLGITRTTLRTRLEALGIAVERLSTLELRPEQQP